MQLHMTREHTHSNKNSLTREPKKTKQVIGLRNIHKPLELEECLTV